METEAGTPELLMGSTSDAARIFFWQPLLSVVAMFVTFWYIRWKVNRSQEARDERLLAEAELRRRQAERLAGGAASDGDLAAMEEKVAALKVKEEREAEFFAIGEDTATSRRYSWGIRPPPTEVSREFAMRFKDKEEVEKPSPSMAESTAEIVVLLLGIVALTVFLLFVSG